MKTEVVVITCLRTGSASHCLPALVNCPSVRVVAVVLATGGSPRTLRFYWRRLKKILKVGPLGACNGRRMRKWYGMQEPDIEELCKQQGIPFYTVPFLNGDETEKLLRSLSPTLGVSLGNGYIAPRIFSIPKLGMINMHSEILPAYQNAQSIIWPIYKKDPYTGFTIHEIERKIDAGRILFQKKYEMEFYPTLEETVRHNKARVDADVPDAISNVCANILELREKAKAQGVGGHYTTPTIWQYIRMVRNNRHFYIAQQRQRGGKE